MKIKLTIDRFEGDMAVLKDGQSSINWPKSRLPMEAKEGSEIFFDIEMTDDKIEAAKRLVNELLGSN